jgi:plasmid stabilization system protein ParE
VFLAEHDPAAAGDAAVAIRKAVEILSDHPLIGRRVEGEIRELVISYGKTGSIAFCPRNRTKSQEKSIAMAWRILPSGVQACY